MPLEAWVRKESKMESILTSVKKMLGIVEEYEYFDPELIIHINSVFSTLAQLGIGPEAGFKIAGKSEEWTDFLDSTSNLEAVKSYVYLRVRLLFDPPTMSAVIDSMTRQISELEWRLNVAAESNTQ